MEACQEEDVVLVLQTVIAYYKVAVKSKLLSEVQALRLSLFTKTGTDLDFRFRFSLFNFLLRRDAQRPDPTRHPIAVLASLHQECET